MDHAKTFENIRKKFVDPEDRKLLKSVEKTLKRNLVTVDLKNHDAFKEIIGHYRKEIWNIQNMLATDRSLTELERGLLFTREDFIKEFLDMFEAAENNVVAINEEMKSWTNAK